MMSLYRQRMPVVGRSLAMLFIRSQGVNGYFKPQPISTRSAQTSHGKQDSPDLTTSEGHILSSNTITIPFAHAKTGSYTLSQPVLGNQFSQDHVLKSYLHRYVGKEYLFPIMSDLERFGLRVTQDIFEHSVMLDNDQPKLVQYSPWGKREDRLILSASWKAMKDIAAEEGLIASAYERQFGQWSRLHQFAKMYVLGPSSGLVDCPLAMTNGAAKILESQKDNFADLHNRAFPRLTSRDPSKFWTSGQWMTEKRGGSDVANGTETLAVEQEDGTYKLYGYKWFSSATDADMTLTLARLVDRDGTVVQGTKGLALFYLETRKPNGEMNNIQMLKLKDKLGTRQMPTAELLIDGATAHRMSDQGRGVASISDMLTLTRIHTGTASTSCMRRITNLARDYATRRQAFRKTLFHHPLHVNILSQMEVETRAATLFMLEVANLLGRQEVLPEGDSAEAEADLLRLIVPLFKLYASKQAVTVTSEGLESFGGQGYIEDTTLPRLLRDVQVNAIWEGTTNILSLDVLRAIKKSSGSVLHNFQQDVAKRLANAGQINALAPAVEKLFTSKESLFKTFASLSPDVVEMAARDFAYSLARIYMGALMVDHASWEQATHADVTAALRWCERDLVPLCTNAGTQLYSQYGQDENMELVYQDYLFPERLN